MLNPIQWVGLIPLERDLTKASLSFGAEVEKNLRLASEGVTTEAKRNFRGSRTRSLYTIRGGRRVKRNPPLPITSPPNMLGVFEGRYRQAITYSVSKSGSRYLSEVGPVGIPYAPAHEFGTGRLPARPVLTPAVEKRQEETFRLIGLSFRVLR